MTGLSKVFWGILLVFLDFRFNGFDVLPDLIGFILMLIGFSQLSTLNIRFNNAKIATIPLLFFSILELFHVQTDIPLSTTEPLSGVAVLLSLCGTVLNLYVIFNLCKGIEELALQSGKMELADMANTRWRYYLWFTIAFTVLSLLVVGISLFLWFLFIPIVICGFIATILILILIRQADQTLRTYEA
ncbi:hypothetical protein ACQCN2_15715 [Brevibacillus ginsengisoli]|uniref:hypothetical protein n=1 Tax=Brevibacillus ginsengisoli TaxID=363854 RepID=UPI003CEC69FA